MAQATSEPKEVKTLKITMSASWYGEGWKAVEEDVNANAEKLGFKLDFDKIAEGDQAKQILQTRAAAGDYPDLLGYNGLGAVQNDLHVEKSILVDMTGADFTKNYDSKVLASNFSVDGTVYAVPLGGSNMPGIFYNRKVFSDLGLTVPTNWTEFLNVCEKAKAAGKTPYFVAGKDPWTVQILAIAGWQRDMKGKDVNQETIDLYTNKTNIVDYALLKDTFAKLKELKDKGYIQKTWLSDTYDAQQKAIVEGTAAMTCNATWMMDEIQKKYPDQMDNVGGFSPVFDGNDPIGAWMPNALVGFNTTKNTDAVKDFLNYFGSLETQTIYFNAQPAISIVKGIKVSGIAKASQEILDQYQNSGNGMTLWQAASVPSSVTSVSKGDFTEYSMNILIGTKTPDEVMKDMRKAMEKDAKTKNVTGW